MTKISVWSTNHIYDFVNFWIYKSVRKPWCNFNRSILLLFLNAHWSDECLRLWEHCWLHRQLECLQVSASPDHLLQARKKIQLLSFNYWIHVFFIGIQFNWLIKSWIKVLFSLTRAINMGASTRRETRGIDCNSSVIVFCFRTATLKFQVFVLTHYLGLKHCGLAFVSHFNVFAHSRTWITTCNSVNKILEIQLQSMHLK